MKIRQIILLAFLCLQFNANASICNCDWEIDLVCIQTDDGNIIPFPNACWASCMGFDEEDFVDCDYNIDFDPTCGCSSDFIPVCAETTSGEVVLFPNACLAECAGYASGDFLNCNYDLPTNPDCGCDYDLDEVCVEIANGIYMPFVNPCWANCAGYSSDDFLNCQELFTSDVELEESLQELYNLIIEDSISSTETTPALGQELNPLKETTILDVAVFPNPINGNELSLKMKVSASSNIRIDLMSVTGKLYKSLNHNVQKGQEVMKIDVNDLAAGIYYVNIYSGKTSTSMKFVKP